MAVLMAVYRLVKNLSALSFNKFLIPDGESLNSTWKIDTVIFFWDKNTFSSIFPLVLSLRRHFTQKQFSQCLSALVSKRKKQITLKTISSFSCVAFQWNEREKYQVLTELSLSLSMHWDRCTFITLLKWLVVTFKQ